MNDNAETLYTQGNYALEQNNFRNAVTCYRAALERQPEDVAILDRLGQAYYHQAEYQKALDVYNIALPLAESRPEDWDVGRFYLTRAEVLIAAGAPEEALVQIEDAERWGVAEDLAQSVYGSAYSAMKQYKEAIGAYTKVLEANPRDWDAYLGLARVYREQHQNDLAAEMLTLAERLVPDEVWVRIEAANLALEQKDYVGALRGFEAVARVSPSNLDALYGLALTQLHLEEWQSAKKLLEKLLTSRPNDTRLLYGLSMAENGLGHTRDSVAYCKAALVADPGNDQAREFLVSLESHSGRWRHALWIALKGATRKKHP